MDSTLKTWGSGSALLGGKPGCGSEQETQSRRRGFNPRCGDRRGVDGSPLGHQVPGSRGGGHLHRSQLAIRVLGGVEAGTSPSLLSSTSIAIRNARRRAGGVSLQLRWCLGHGGLRGNVDTDREARMTADRRATRAELLPRKIAKLKPRKNPKTEREDMKIHDVK